MTKKIIVYIDQFKGNALSSSWEAIGAGLELADKLGSDGVTALVLGSGIEAIAQQAVSYGAKEVIAVENDELADYRAEPYTSAIVSAVTAEAPEVILFPTTTRGRELAGMVAIDLNTGVLVDVISLEVEDGTVIATRPIYAGKLLCKVQCSSSPQIITLRNRAFNRPVKDEGRGGNITTMSPDTGQPITTVLAHSESIGGVSLADASVIVSGGRGVANNPKLVPPDGLDDKEAEIWRAKQGYALIQELADLLGAAVGASRASVDAEYIAYENQVGQTGKIVAPDLYIACGLSGAIQHLAGMRASKVIVAINKDGDAPIFSAARYGVVGDLFDILPPLTKALRVRLGK